MTIKHWNWNKIMNITIEILLLASLVCMSWMFHSTSDYIITHKFTDSTRQMVDAMAQAMKTEDGNLIGSAALSNFLAYVIIPMYLFIKFMMWFAKYEPRKKKRNKQQAQEILS